MPGERKRNGVAPCACARAGIRERAHTSFCSGFVGFCWIVSISVDGGLGGIVDCRLAVGIGNCGLQDGSLWCGFDGVVCRL